MEKKNSIPAAAIVLLVIIALLVWYLPISQEPAEVSSWLSNGQWVSPWDTVNGTGVSRYAQKWLLSEKGKESFTGALAGEPVPVFEEKGGLFSWIVPIRDNDGFYIGHMSFSVGGPEYPDTYIRYGEPKPHFLSRNSAADIEAFFIIGYGDYSEEQIKEPYLIIKETGGYWWISEVLDGNKIIDRLYSRVSIE